MQVYFSDLDNIWDFISRLVWFATPIFYSIGGQNRLHIANIINPMYYYISIPRDIVIYSKIPGYFMIAGAVFFSVASLLIGIVIFNRLKYKFAEFI